MALSEQLENEYRAAVERVVREARASGVTGGVPVPSKWQWMSAEVERLRGEYSRLTEADLIFRQLLFAAHGFGYGDDGEMQNTKAIPFIDFKRDTANEIEAAIFQRNMQEHTAAPETAAQGATPDVR